uniref:Uncharacterized protein n=1 Tax=Bombyx mori TaxID=7091 RepID=A0A8R2R2Q6_BOMMO|nr:uncharacterized protein LOC101747164 [Bombyx mori]
MKLFIILTLCALAAAKPWELTVLNDAPEEPPQREPLHTPQLPQTVEELVAELLKFIYNVVENGWPIFNLPPLEPLVLEYFELPINAGIINVELKLKDAIAFGFGNLIVHKIDLNVDELTLDIDIGLPTLDITAENYELVGDFFGALPLFGNGRAEFEVEGFRFRAKLFLEQHENKKSVVINRVENAAFTIPHLKSNLSGVIGGGSIDAVINKLIEEVIIGYVNRFHGAISIVTSTISTTLGNDNLKKLDTWKYIEAVRS